MKRSLKIIVAKNSGFCSGVQNAVDLAKKYAANNVYSLGEIIHNPIVVRELEKAGVKVIGDLSEAPDGSAVIIRSHGAAKELYERAKLKNIRLIDATCEFVKNIQGKAERYYKNGYQIVLIGQKKHPEIISINSRCGGEALIFDSLEERLNISGFEKVCILTQTTYSQSKYDRIVQNIIKDDKKTVEIFITICYTTSARQAEAEKLSKICDVMIVLGGLNSSNTAKLKEVCEKFCKNVFHIESGADLDRLDLNKIDKQNIVIGISSGASTPKELIEEVIFTMNSKHSKEVLAETEFAQAVENLSEKKPKLYKGKKIKATIVSFSDEGIMMNIGGKREAVIPNDQTINSGTPEEIASRYKIGDEIEVEVLACDKAPYTLSHRAVEEVNKPDPAVEAVRDGAEFEQILDGTNKGGLVGKLGTYALFVPASQIRSGFVTNLEQYTGKPLRLSVISIDDKNKKIVAGQKVILERERDAKEEAFWAVVAAGQRVKGRVVRFSDFGAFIDVNGFDCLAHKTDLSWGSIKQPSDILTIGESYDFLVLKASRERNRVSLGFRQLQQNPWDAAAEKYPAGTEVEGVVVEIKPYGAYVQVESGLDGLVHISNISYDWIASISEKIAMGDKVKARVIEVDAGAKRLSLSIKATLPPPVREQKPKPQMDGANAADAANGEEKPKTRLRGERANDRASDTAVNARQTASKQRFGAVAGAAGGGRFKRESNGDEGPREYFSDNGASSIADMLAALKIETDEDKPIN
jgi:4-hydroxy-3-methylbut-2-enyl diphosphate reductase